MPGSTVDESLDGPWAGLVRILHDAKAGDPLAPVTVVAPSGYAAVFVRRTLGSSPGPRGARGWANVSCTTVPALLQMLAAPPLATRRLRLASPTLDLEVIRAQAHLSEDWIRSFSGHPSALSALQSTLVELRRCPPATLATIGRRPGRARDLVALLDAVRRHLHDCGLADSSDVATDAVAVARRHPESVRALGPLVGWQLGDLAPAERELLDVLGSRETDRATSPGNSSLTEMRPCPDPDEEARVAVRSVITALDTGTFLWQQAVFHPPGPTYGRILHQHLTAAGVACNGPEARRLHHSMTGRVLLGLLDLAGSDWPRHQVLAWISAGPVTVDSGGRPVPASRWDAVSAAAGVVRGLEQWRDRLGRLSARGGTDADEADALARFVDELMHRTAPPGRSWAALSNWAVGLLDHYLSADYLSADYLSADLSPAAQGARWPAAEETAARQVRGVVSSLRDLDAVSAGADLNEFRATVRTQLETTVLDAHDLADGGFGDGVFLAPYAGARGLRFHSVVITGLADALVPGRGGTDDLLGDDVRQMDTSGALWTRRQRQEAARLDLNDAVACGISHRIGTRPRCDPRSGRSLVPTRWIGDLVAADTRHREVDSFAAGLAATEPAVSAREFRLRELDRWVRGGGDPFLIPGEDDLRLRRGIEAGRGRVDTRFTRYDGNIGRGRLSAFDPGMPVSATRFETYAKCPRRYLFDRVLRVSERVRPEDLWRIEPMTRGTLVHAILEAYVTERVNGAPRSLERLLAIATEQLDDAESGGLVGKPLLWRMDRAAIIRDLLRFDVEEGDLEPHGGRALVRRTGPRCCGRRCCGRPGSRRHRSPGRRTVGGLSGQRRPRRPDRLGTSDGVGLQDGAPGASGRPDPRPGGRGQASPAPALRHGRLGPLRRAPARPCPLLAPVGERSAPCFHLVVTDEVETRFRHVVA
jgi:ATP-dependent helicase/nuclease subunit B